MSEKVVFLTYRCQVCSRFLPQAEPFFSVNLEVVSGTNQLLEGSPRPDQVASELQALTAAIDKMDPQQLEDEVYFTRRFRLCPACRGRVLRFLNLLV